MNDAARPDLVFGASGYIGTNLVEFLLSEGRNVRASSRNIEVLKGRGWEDAALYQADALDASSLDEALDGIDTAYYLVHSMAAGKSFPAASRKQAIVRPSIIFLCVLILRPCASGILIRR